MGIAQMKSIVKFALYARGCRSCFMPSSRALLTAEILNLSLVKDILNIPPCGPMPRSKAWIHNVEDGRCIPPN